MNTTGTQTTINLAPENRRNFVAVKSVDNAAGLLSLNQVFVDVARVAQCGLNCLFGDFVKHHSLHRNLWLEHLQKVPGNGLTLTVFIGGEIELIRVLQGCLEVAHGLALAGRNGIHRLEVVLDVD